MENKNIIGLDPELDKLRNKELSFGRMVGHPLTRGRIQLLMVQLEPKLEMMDPVMLLVAGETNTCVGLYRFFKKYLLYDQDELQRMQHEKRPELKNLLLKFGDYL